jgi:hypothetical protein
MKITTLTGTLTLLLAGCLTLTVLLPAIDSYVTETSPAVGSVAGISIGGVVEPTPVNTLYAELEKEKVTLDTKSKELEAQQKYISSSNKTNMLAIYAAIIVLFGLVVTNFYFDIRRNGQQKTA